MKKFVIAYSRAEADHWIKNDLDKRLKAGETTLSKSEYVYVDDIIRIRGVQDPHGVFVGRWRERLDILDILQAMIARGNNPVLINLFNTINAPVKPTPKIRKTPLIVHINGVMQSENRDYVVSDEFVTFTQAPPARTTITFQTVHDVIEYTGNGSTIAFRRENPPQHSVSYQEIVPVLIKGMQELHNEIKELKNARNIPA